MKENPPRVTSTELPASGADDFDEIAAAAREGLQDLEAARIEDVKGLADRVRKMARHRCET